ncbi:type II toxin-antitoxin system PemK/MazF family toxin [Erwiniaceae bacterium L1_55_4]|nr:type II toxin-antitoxin system PemK/MazF family toxin [Erwiniaceae bacterium L1_55_4]
MSAVKICYFKPSPSGQGPDQLLGRETLEGFSEVLIPTMTPRYPVFITKAFTGETCKRWFVKRVSHVADDEWHIRLIDRSNAEEVYLSETLKLRSRTSAEGFLRKGTIVIVEFGHIYQTLDFGSGLTAQNTSYFCSHLSGEMHKRRPAIVVSADSRGVKVVPVTSQEPEGSMANKSIFELESVSTRHIDEFDPAKQSYALCEMIQTISPSRILPPLAKDSKYGTRTFRRDQSYFRKLSGNDLKALEDGLLAAVGMSSLKRRNQDLLAENKAAQTEVQKMNVQITRLAELLAASQDTERRLLGDTTLLATKYRILEALYRGAAGNPAPEEVEAEILEYLQLDVTDK